ncbi:MAG: hypothetical protein K2Z81_10125, partial [Cyanobacteria bacterium]|nr:hypothetical protein [Cyanobacteriota bacterium]
AIHHGIDNEHVLNAISVIENKVSVKELPPDEVSSTYDQLTRLLETESKHLTTTERETLAQQVLLQTADPTTIDQGEYSTCNITTVECRMYSRKPSTVAKFLTDLALTGEFIASDGKTKVACDPRPVGNHASMIPHLDQFRSHASELFQNAAVNLYWEQKTGGLIRYNQLEPGAGTSDVHEELVDCRESTPKFIDDSPNLPDNGLIDINDLITGEVSKEWVISHKSYVEGSEDKLAVINSLNELIDKLDRTPPRDFPLVISVHSANEPFWTERHLGVPGAKPGDKGGGHFVTIRDYWRGPPPSVMLDNQWGFAADHNEPSKRISVEDLYRATQRPADSVKVLAADNARRRTDGNVWSANEFEQIRLEMINEEKPDFNLIEQRILDTMRAQQGRWNDESQRGTFVSLEKEAGMRELEDLVRRIPEDQRIRARDEEHRLGLISDTDLEDAVFKYGQFIHSSKATPEQERIFYSVVNKLTQAAQLRVLNKFGEK